MEQMLIIMSMLLNVRNINYKGLNEEAGKLLKIEVDMLNSVIKDHSRSINSTIRETKWKYLIESEIVNGEREYETKRNFRLRIHLVNIIKLAIVLLLL